MAQVIITGANRGIGLQMVKELIDKPPVKPMHIFACARKPPSPSPVESSSDVKVDWHKLDIGDKDSIAEFATAVKEACPEGVDVLVNNAGINVDTTEGHGLKQAELTIGTNHDGTIDMTQALVPLMRRPGIAELGTSRIVNISSVGSKLHGWTQAQNLVKAFKTSSTQDQVQDLRDHYLNAVYEGCESDDGWPRGKSYSVSKSLINASTCIIAAENKDLLINCCCPGWVKSDMGGLVGQGGKTLEEGTRVPLNLAFGPIRETGQYWENPSVTDTGKGKVSDW